MFGGGLNYIMIVGVVFWSYSGPNDTFVSVVETHVVPGVYSSEDKCVETANKLLQQQRTVFSAVCVPTTAKD